MRRTRYNRGGGLWDVIKNPISTIKEAFRSVPTRLPNASQRTLEQYGNIPITEMAVARTPLAKSLNTVMNVLNGGKMDKLRQKYFGDMPLFHVSLLVGLQGGKKIVLEKNESADIAPLTNQFNNKTEYLPLNISGKHLTLNKLVNDGIAYAGDKFFSYRGLGANNCQNFVLEYLLGPQGLSDNRTYNFAFQDMAGLEHDLKRHDGGFTERVMNKVTDFGNFFSRLTGKGPRNPNIEDLVAAKIYPIFKKEKFRLF